MPQKSAATYIVTFNGTLRSYTNDPAEKYHCASVSLANYAGEGKFAALQEMLGDTLDAASIYLSFELKSQGELEMHTFGKADTTYRSLGENTPRAYFRADEFAEFRWGAVESQQMLHAQIFARIDPKDEAQFDDVIRFSLNTDEILLVHVGSAVVHVNDDLRLQTVPIMHEEDAYVSIGTLSFSALRILPYPFKAQTARRDEKSNYLSAKDSLFIGHRGCGADEWKRANTQVSLDEPIENTVKAFEKGGSIGYSMVELDVQIASDGIPVIYHDFCVTAHHNKTPVRVPVCILKSKDMTLYKKCPKPQRTFSQTLFDGLQSVLGYISPLRMRQRLRASIERFTKLPLYAQVLLMTSRRIGFNVEVKYPFFSEERDLMGHTVFADRNAYVDAILEETFEHACERTIVFSSFSPEICLLLKAKQQRYPVLFLIMEEGEGVQTPSIFAAAMFVRIAGLDGIVCECSWVEKAPDCVAYLHDHDKVLWTYGDRNNECAFAQKQRALGVDRVITDSLTPADC